MADRGQPPGGQRRRSASDQQRPAIHVQLWFAGSRWACTVRSAWWYAAIVNDYLHHRGNYHIDADHDITFDFIHDQFHGRPHDDGSPCHHYDPSA